MLLIGIDPGLEGAIAFLTADHSVGPRVVPTPTITSPKGRPQYDLGAMLDLLREHRGRALAVVEKQQPLPAAMGGSSANYHRGRALALWEMALAAVNIPYEIVEPRRWQKLMHAGTSGEDTKQRSIVAAQRAFPGIDLRRTPRCKKPHDGYADALLLAEWARRSRPDLALTPATRSA